MTVAPGQDDRQCLADAVRASLRGVIDPELGENLIDLGLIYFVAVDDRSTAHVVMTTTTQGCPAVGYLKEGVQHAALAVTGVKGAEVAVTYDPPWTPDMMTSPAENRRPSAKPRFWRPW
ncbi:MAG: metal-sulfur cluster assembly factor [Hoeflea sp.]|uniref:metal-sulfur cluster assembly factor n=1 Tax=Hoeflea sp. TaxID=1940281 RepID=UPI001DD133D1|nr:metal-sulfur cluster assembly factor [Hoeflea sp.]MBU4531993.1 metal-sulfur cluster assembly factor [Alphaproteobacteria bacterium]MBU4546415.1 metal-sulfur cluster assembly factor [Alphaproteobacteria bacterium]MBU4549544.1 metal-sulfur cluster assembly factor [Alphaproteobacteria bacterium]MBV1722719.1 metal-sulfur cluster assembly factor [Hoeflea sp.]MBV1782658.1 metal-sulfur cluster assembly factor [Hoeflea sp.]